jgi:hypothetical protein
LLCLASLAGCGDRSLPHSDLEYARYFEDNHYFFNGILELSRQSTDLPSEVWPRDTSKAPKALQELLVGKSNLARIDFGTRFVKIYVETTGIVGIPGTAKGFIGYKEDNDCHVSDNETEQMASKLIREENKAEATAFRKLNDRWCIFYTIEME